MDSLINARDSINLQNSSLLNVISGGGELNLSLQTPIFDLNGNHKKLVKFKMELIGQISIDTPINGQAIPEKEINTFNSLGFGK